MSFTAPWVTVEVGYGSTWQTEPGSITWTDETARVLVDGRVRCTRGASSARGKVDVGTAEFSLLNTDRRFDPTHATGDLFGQLLPGTPVRLLAWPVDQLLMVAGQIVLVDGLPVTTGSSIELWSGTVPSWPQRYDKSNRHAWCPINAWDRFDKLSRAKIPRSVLEAEVLADSPDAYWRLDETAETDGMLDSSGNYNHGDYDNVAFGDPLVFDDFGGAISTSHVGDSRGRYVGSTLPQAAPVTLEAWVQFDRELSEWHTFITNVRDYAAGSGVWLGVRTSADGSPDGELVIDFRGLGGFLKARGTTRIDDNEVHHVVMTMASNAAADIKLYVDGVEETKTVVSGTTGGSWPNHLIWAVGNFPDNGAGDFGLGGAIDEVAVFPSALSAARVLAHYEAGSAPLLNDRTDERITWVLDEIGWPAGFRDLSQGRSLLGAAQLRAGDNALQYLRSIEATEDGLLFIGPDGSLSFHDRFWRYLETVATVSQFTFTDQDGDQGYAEFQLDLDDELLVNVARLTRRGGREQVSVDATSVAAYGEAETVVTDLLSTTDAQVKSLADWLVATRSNPLPRVPSIRIPLHRYSAADQATVLGLDLGHRVTVNRTPQGVGSQIDLDFLVEGVSHDIGFNEWWVTLFVSPTPDEVQELFILGSSELGGTDVLAH